MDVEQNLESRTPFQGAFKPAHFFAEGGGGAALADIEEALRAQVGIVTLIGDEGSGKSVLCEMLRNQLENPAQIVFLPRALKSFEEIVRVVARECDLENLAETDGGDTKKIFMDLIAALRIRGESLLLICDEAEKMYLATFERIRKALDEINRQGGGLQLLFSGRKRLAGYFEQLHLCDFAEVAEREVLLPGFTGGELERYLNFHMRMTGGEGRQELFSRKAAERIAAMAGGNLRLVNTFADEALQAARGDRSSEVLSEYVSEDTGAVKGEHPLLVGIRQRLSLLRQFPLPNLPLPKAYIMGGAAVLSLLLLFLLLGGDDDKDLVQEEEQVEEAVVSTLQEEVQVREAVVSTPKEKVQAREAVVSTPKEEGQVKEAVVSTPKEEGRVREAVVSRPKAEPAKTAVEDESAPLSTKVQLAKAAETETSGPARQEPELGKIVSAGEEVELKEMSELPLSGSLAGEVVSSQEAEAVDEGTPAPDHPLAPWQHRPVDISPVEIVENGPGSAVVPKLTGPSKVSLEGPRHIQADAVKKLAGRAGATPVPPGPAVLAAPLASGKRWQAGENRDEFTIQLMALASGEAEENLRQMMSQSDYQEIAHKLVMLKRPSDPPVVLVYFGLYPSMAAARSARNNMPIFLRKHHPYALSVKRAVEKGHME